MFQDQQFVSLFLLLPLTWQSTQPIYRSSCRSAALFKTTNRNQILVGNSGGLISSIRTRNLPSCVRQCIKNPICSSINYKSTPGSNQENNCQLLTINLSSNDAEFSSLVGWIHSEPTSQPGPRCVVNPCSLGYRCTDTCDVTLGYQCTGNIALNRPTAHSSIWDGFDSSSRAVNGQTGTNYLFGFCAHTAQQLQPWWRVDLGATYSIGTVKVTNRGDCCPERLADFHVYVGDNLSSIQTNAL
eukprot:gene2210-17812_t